MSNISTHVQLPMLLCGLFIHKYCHFPSTDKFRCYFHHSCSTFCLLYNIPQDSALNHLFLPCVTANASLTEAGYNSLLYQITIITVQRYTPHTDFRVKPYKWKSWGLLGVIVLNLHHPPPTPKPSSLAVWMFQHREFCVKHVTGQVSLPYKLSPWRISWHLSLSLHVACNCNR